MHFSYLPLAFARPDRHFSSSVATDAGTTDASSPSGGNGDDPRQRGLL